MPQFLARAGGTDYFDPNPDGIGSSAFRLSCRAGFGLPATIILLVVFALLGVAGLSLARQELKSQVRVISRETAFYAAEVGLARGMQNWKSTAFYQPGATWPVDQGHCPAVEGIESRAGYWAIAVFGRSTRYAPRDTPAMGQCGGPACL